MLNENEMLSQAAREMREARMHQDVLDRGEAAIMARVGRRPLLLRLGRPLLLGAGAAAAVAGVAMFATPAKVSAAQIMRIVSNDGGALRRIRTYESQPDGSSKLVFEQYAQNGRRRFTDRYGNTFVYDGQAGAMVHPDGAVTLERGASVSIPPEEGSAQAVLAQATYGKGVQLDVRHGVVDHYIVRGGQVHIAFEADPKTQRPLSMRTSSPGSPDITTTWEYLAPSPSLFHLPIGPKTRVYDLTAERAAVQKALEGPGRTVTVGGKTVELLQLWVDERGRGMALTRADYVYPDNYGIHIDDYKTWTAPEEAPFSGRYAGHTPHLIDGKWVQIFTTGTPTKSFRYPDRVTLRIPVFQGKQLTGYARFADVPVHRTWDIYSFIDPAAPFFGDPAQKLPDTPAQADNS